MRGIPAIALIVVSLAQARSGLQWAPTNLDVETPQSYCYDDADQNCRRYGRLYTWRAAQDACRSLGDGWRLPADAEWREMAKRYGGVGGDSSDGKAAYQSLVSDGGAGFGAVLGGNRTRDGKYERLEAHGFYWTASSRDAETAPFYNFGKGSLALYRQEQGDKQMAVSVRCVKD